MTTPLRIPRRDDPSHAQAAVELRGVSRHYGDRHAPVRALDGVRLACARGSWTAIMARRGPASRRRCTAPPAWTAPTPAGCCSASRTSPRHRIGFVFQTFNLVGSLTAEQNVALPLTLAGHRVARAEVRQVLARVGLDERRKHRPRELSGGSTFAFTVAQRRRELALPRLAGAGRGRLRRLPLGEAVLLGVLGTGPGYRSGSWPCGCRPGCRATSVSCRRPSPRTGRDPRRVVTRAGRGGRRWRSRRRRHERPHRPGGARPRPVTFTAARE